MLALILATLALTLPPCDTEDATNCAWIAADHGNAEGADFIDLGGVAYYLDGGSPTPTN